MSGFRAFIGYIEKVFPSPVVDHLLIALGVGAWIHLAHVEASIILQVIDAGITQPLLPRDVLTVPGSIKVADRTINDRTTEQWSAAVLDLTAGRGADHVMEIGGPGTLSQSMEACRIGGRIAMIGILTGGKGEVRTGLLI